MQKKPRVLALGAILAALYGVLTHLQNMLLPGSANLTIQFRASECLCVLALFTPAAVPGLTLGCVLYNFTAGSSLPLDFLVGGLATFLSTAAMSRCKKHPGLSLCFPPLCNGLLVGWELSVTAGGGFWLQVAYVAAGEGMVMLLLGWPLYRAIRGRKLQDQLFS